MWSTIGAFFTAIGKALGLIAQRDTEKNTAAVQAAAVAAQEQKNVDEATTAVAKGDAQKIRNEIAE